MEKKTETGLEGASMKRRTFITAAGSTAIALAGCTTKASPNPGVYGAISGPNFEYDWRVSELDDPDGWVDSMTAKPRIPTEWVDDYDPNESAGETPPPPEDISVTVTLTPGDELPPTQVSAPNGDTVGTGKGLETTVYVEPGNGPWTVTVENKRLTFPFVVPIPWPETTKLGQFTFDLAQVQKGDR